MRSLERVLSITALLAVLFGGLVATARADEADSATDGSETLDGRADWRAPAFPLPAASEEAASTPTPTPTPAPIDSVDRTVTSGNAAPTLGPIGPQRVIAGKRYRLHLRLRDAGSPTPRLLVRNLPDGATLVDNGGGRYRIDWTPPFGLRGRVDVTLVAIDGEDERLRSERVMRLLLVRGSDPSPEPALQPAPVPEPTAVPKPVLDDPEPELDLETTPDPSIASTDESDVDPDNPGFPRVAPSIEPFPTQIVSAGRTVAFRVAANLPDEQLPLLQIDRLPRNASFDPNADGSRTFHWPTVDTDQGEHRFRITSLHPEDETLVSRVDLLIVVGDPSRARTVPLELVPDDARREGALPEESVPDEISTDDSRPEEPSAGARDDTFDASATTEDDEPFLPQADDELFLPQADDGSFLPQADDDGTNYFAPGPGDGVSQGFPEFGGELPAGFEETGPGSGFEPPEGDYFAPPDADD